MENISERSWIYFTYIKSSFSWVFLVFSQTASLVTDILTINFQLTFTVLLCFWCNQPSFWTLLILILPILTLYGSKWRRSLINTILHKRRLNFIGEKEKECIKSSWQLSFSFNQKIIEIVLWFFVKYRSS